MTELRLPPLVVDHSQLWFQVDLSTNQDWGWRVTAQLLARPQWARYRTPVRERQLTVLMKRVAVIAREQAGPSLGFVLIPSPEDGIKGMATLSPVDLEGQNADTALAELTRQLAPVLAAGSGPDISRMQTPAGDCRRLRHRQAGREPGGPDSEQIGYLWVVADYGAMTLLMSFTRAHEADRWLPALDQLASSVRLQPSGGEPSLATSAGAAALGPGGVVEIRPVRPDGKLLVWERKTLANWRLAADPHSGMLTLSGDRPFGSQLQVFALPSMGQPGAVTAICLAAHGWEIGQRSGSSWRMLFLDQENRLAGAGFGRDYWRALRLFPPQVFEPMKAAGLRVVSEWYDSAQALEDAHPGAASAIELVGERRGRVAAIGLVGALVIFIVVVVAVYFSTH